MQKILATLGSPLWRIVRNLTHRKQTCVGPLSRCSVLVALLFAATHIPAQIIVTNAYIAHDSTANYSGIGVTPPITEGCLHILEKMGIGAKNGVERPSCAAKKRERTDKWTYKSMK
jgi:hypothetical protein